MYMLITSVIKNIFSKIGSLFVVHARPRLKIVESNTPCQYPWKTLLSDQRCCSFLTFEFFEVVIRSHRNLHVFFYHN
jgi:hypothetical protein